MSVLQSAERDGLDSMSNPAERARERQMAALNGRLKKQKQKTVKQVPTVPQNHGTCAAPAPLGKPAPLFAALGGAQEKLAGLQR
jgi:hypothetical protein